MHFLIKKMFVEYILILRAKFISMKPELIRFLLKWNLKKNIEIYMINMICGQTYYNYDQNTRFKCRYKHI